MTTPLFHVFIEGARSTAPGASGELARAIAARYGLPAAELEKRFAMGRFRVKGNVERATAESYAADLASLGAVVAVVPAAAPPPTMVPAVTLPSAARMAPPARSAPEGGGGMADLGALSGEVPLTLSTLDGADDASASRSLPLPASFGPPDDAHGRSSSRDLGLPASFGPADDEPPATRSSSRDLAAAAAAAAYDPFAPPESQTDAPELVLAVERPARRSAPPSSAGEGAAPRAEDGAGRAGTIAPPPEAAGAPGRGGTTAPPSAAAPTTGGRPAGSALGFLRDDGARFIAGVVLAVAVGAVPALLVGGARERSAFAKLDGELADRQGQVTTRDEWDGLDRVRATIAERKRSDRQAIAITTLLLWAVLSGGVAWVWFRKVDWDRVLE
ncbi:MAG: hypothetical protein R3B06_15725 [Kofleriaceae bacterium]